MFISLVQKWKKYFLIVESDRNINCMTYVKYYFGLHEMKIIVRPGQVDEHVYLE